MKVSIIIVTYNTRYFLEQCLISVFKAIDEWSTARPKDGDIEVFVVDNNSSDGTLEYIAPAFPSVHLISNEQNTGFSRANNQVLPFVKGEYVLFLNPDTIIPGDFFLTSVSYFDDDRSIGAIGVQMINGQGHFLKESKRGFPTPWASFSRLSGLAALFPHSRRFAKYYLGHLDKDVTHEVEALSGACMMIRKEVLDKTGGFDERFFMYAEDIDLSFRVRQLGYKNIYLAGTTIIHFKGQSTVRNRRYVKLFYKAMIQFVEKHYSTQQNRLCLQFLKMAIFFRGLLELGKQQFKRKQIASKGLRFYTDGDELGIREVKQIGLRRASIVQENDRADGTILCEGKDMSFKRIIELMKGAPGTNYHIHSHGSTSVVGDLLSIQTRAVYESREKM